MPRIPPIPNQQFGALTSARGLARGLSLAGITGETSWDFEDFTAADSGSVPRIPWTSAIAGSATVNTAPAGQTYRGGLFRYTTGATAGSVYKVRSATYNIRQCGTDKWYVFARFAIKTAVSAQTIAGIGLYDDGTGNTCLIGVLGWNSTTLYGIQCDNVPTAGTVANTGTSIDTNLHVFELYNKGDSVLRGRIDYGAETSVTQTNAAALIWEQHIFIRNGTDAVTRDMDIDFIGILTERA